VSETLDAVVHCPACRAGQPAREGEAYVCPACGRRYPVVDGVPRLLPDLPTDLRQTQRVFDFEHRRYQDSRFTRFEPTLVDEFLADSGLPAEFFRSKRALDAGCGSGRWTYALAELGADVVAFDLTPGGVEVAQANVGPRDNVSICQADIFRPPFEPGSFEFVMSWGVLHHTPSTRRAFDSIVGLVKPGGTLYVMIYEHTRPVRLFGTNLLRRVMRRLSDERRYRACRRLVIRNRTLARLLDPFLMIAYADPATVAEDAKTLQFGLFDAYSPRYNHTHSRDEVVSWFEQAGFEDVTVVDAHETVKVRGVAAAGG
jgi:SAM-dependent methyltransferase